LSDKAKTPDRPSRFLPHLSIAAGLLAFVLTAATINDIGITTDEPGYYKSCLQQIEWFKQAGGAIASGNWIEPFSRENIDRYWDFSKIWNVYAAHPSFYLICSSVSLVLFDGIFGPIGAYRLSPALMFSVLVGLLFWVVGRRYGTAAGAWAAGAFFLMPRVFGHSHIGATDMPITLLWFASAVSFHRALESRGWAAVFALVYGMALATKFTAFVIPVPLLIFILLSRKSKQAVLPVVLALIFSPLVMIGLNPQWWPEIYERVGKYLAYNFLRSEFYQINIKTYYLGKQYLFYLPWHHCLVYTAFTVPPVALAGFLYGVFKTVKRPLTDLWATHMLLHWLVLMVVMMLPSSPGHDGVRLFLPSFAFIAVISAKGFYHFTSETLPRLIALLPKLGPRAVTASRWLLLSAMLLPSGVVLARLHPYELCYYNILAGGMPGAQKLGMETTYWWDPVNESACELINTTLPDSTVVYTRNNDYFQFLQELGLIKPSIKFVSGKVDFLFIYCRQGIYRDIDRIILLFGCPMLEIRKDGVLLLAVYPYKESLTEILDKLNGKLEMANAPAKLHYQVALIYHYLEDNDSCIQKLEQYLELEPDDFQANSLLSGIYLDRNMPGEAVRLLQRAPENIADQIPWHHSLASAYYMMGNIERAIYHLEAILKEKSFEAKAHAKLGLIYYNGRNFREAANHFELALISNSHDTELLYKLGWINQLTGNIDKAGYYYEKLLEMKSEEVGTLSNMGVLAIQRGDTARAESLFLQALAMDSADLAVNTNLGNLYQTTGRKFRAEKHFKIVAAADSANFQAHLNLANFYFDNPERWPEALEEFRIAAGLIPDQADYIEQTYIIPLQKKMDSLRKGP